MKSRFACFYRFNTRSSINNPKLEKYIKMYKNLNCFFFAFFPEKMWSLSAKKIHTIFPMIHKIFLMINVRRTNFIYHLYSHNIWLSKLFYGISIVPSVVNSKFFISTLIFVLWLLLFLFCNSFMHFKHLTFTYRLLNVQRFWDCLWVLFCAISSTDLKNNETANNN